MHIDLNSAEVVSVPVFTRESPLHPVIRWIVRCRDRKTGRWWYVVNVRSGRVRFSRDQLYARCYSYRTARLHQANIPNYEEA